MQENKRRKLTYGPFGSEINAVDLQARKSQTLVDLTVEALEPQDENYPIEDEDNAVEILEPEDENYPIEDEDNAVEILEPEDENYPIEDEVENGDLTDADKLEALLTGWGVTDFNENLRRCGINYSNMKFLEENDYPLLLKNYPKLGQMITFRNFHRQWKTSTTDPKSEDKTVDVKDVLDRGGKIGNELKRFFALHHYLTDTLRLNLIRLVLKEQPKFTRPELSNIADQFVMIFPGELKHVYYNKLPGKEPTGLLYKEYNKTRTKKALTKSMAAEESSEQSIDDLLSDDVRASIEFLNNEDNIIDGRDGEIIRHWEDTFEYRDKKTYENAENFIIDWLPLQKSDGYIMVEIDFVKKFGSSCAQSLKNGWEDFSFANHNVMVEGCRDPLQRKALLGAMSEDDINVKDRIIVMALHHLSYLVPTKVVTKTTWTPSITQSKAAFYRTVKNRQNIPTEMKRRDTFRNEKGIDPHPIIIETSNNSEHFVAIGKTIYECASFIEAVDVTFKIFVMLKISFPPECLKVWLFLNELFYKLDLKQKASPQILSVLSSYKK